MGISMTKIRPITLSDSFLECARIQLKRLLEKHEVQKIDKKMWEFEANCVGIEFMDAVSALLEIAFDAGYCVGADI
jgi:maltoporin